MGFTQSFGASGSQSRAVDSGQPADVVAFSTTPDMTRLVKDRARGEQLGREPEKGFSSDSLGVIVVRKGNPKHITGWDDLTKPGVDVVTPNPSTSGAPAGTSSRATAPSSRKARPRHRRSPT